MKVKMLKSVNADGAFRKPGDIIDVTEDQANELIRTGDAEKASESPAPKKVKK
tara:strand:- start:273 stop:431 length:159 start_codon:yes stop_codon:yes gene_type:complete